MQRRIVLRHPDVRGASRAEEFPVEGLRDLLIGVDLSCPIRIDADAGDLVSPHHARILIDTADPVSCSIVDQNSRNGTYVNRQRIYSAVKLVPGDLVELGAGGPILEFDIEPRPPGVRPSRSASRIPRPAAAAVDAPPGPFPAGMVAEAGRKSASGHRMLMVALIALLAVAVGALAVRNARKEKSGAVQPGTRAIPPEEILRANRSSIGYFEAAWKLVDSRSGEQIHHVYQANAMKDTAGRIVPILADAGGFLPVFMALPGDANLEPLLSRNDGQRKYKPVGGAQTGSGVVAGSDGLILTSRQVAAAWNASYRWPREDTAGLVYVVDEKLAITSRRIISFSEFPDWMPSAAKLVLSDAFDGGASKLPAHVLKPDPVEGRNSYLDISFPESGVRIPAQLVQVSSRADTALARIEAQQPIRKAEFSRSTGLLKPGDRVLVAGYPILSVEQGGWTGTALPELSARPIPQISAGAGSVAGTAGELYRLSLGASADSSPGSPVFDAQGSVIALSTAGRGTPGGAQEVYAVPVRYGLELLEAGQVKQ